MPLSEGVLLERGRQTAVPLNKKRYFADISSCCVKTVADMYRHAAIKKHW